MAKRITFTDDYTPKPEGVLESVLTQVEYYGENDKDKLPNMRSVQDPLVKDVFKVIITPEGHEDRPLDYFITLQVVFNANGEVNLADSKGIRQIHELIMLLGLSKAGFHMDGKFIMENGDPIPYDTIAGFLNDYIRSKPCKLYTSVYKQLANNGKRYFRMSPFLFSFDQEGFEKAKAHHEDNLNYEKAREANMNQTVTPPPERPASAPVGQPNRRIL